MTSGHTNYCILTPFKQSVHLSVVVLLKNLLEFKAY